MTAMIHPPAPAEGVDPGPPEELTWLAPRPAGPRDDLVRVFDHDPDLLDGLDEPTVQLLRRRATVRRQWIEAGPWTPPANGDGSGLGFLVLEGLLVRSVGLTGREYPELVGAGDLLRPWDHDGATSSIAHEARWAALERSSVAVLDERFAAIAARWPTIVGHLLGRAVQRSRTLAFHLATAHVRHADTRLLMVLWHLADRWGRMTSQGVHVPLALTHELLAHLACMRRPTASSAVQRLMRSGELARRADGTWVLLGTPPEVHASCSTTA